jgi:hypothetical protein
MDHTNFDAIKIIYENFPNRLTDKLQSIPRKRHKNRQNRGDNDHVSRR